MNRGFNKMNYWYCINNEINNEIWFCYQVPNYGNKNIYFVVTNTLAQHVRINPLRYKCLCMPQLFILPRVFAWA